MNSPADLSHPYRPVHLATALVALTCFLAAHGQPAAEFSIALDGSVTSLAVQGDGKILATGGFTVPGAKDFARFNADGTLDSSFQPNLDGSVNALAVQPDGRILVCGYLRRLGGTALARCNTDGSLDAAFGPVTNTLPFLLYSIAVQPDGRILLAGALNGSALWRLNADLTLDPTFASVSGGPVHSMILQPDGRILVVGPTTNGPAGLYRLNADGTRDASFHLQLNSRVRALALQADGKVLVTGFFMTSTDPTSFFRLLSDGSVDSTFRSDLDGESVQGMAVQADGSILVASTSGQRLARITPEGRLDSGFTLDLSRGDRLPKRLAIRTNGSILLVSAVNGQQGVYLERFPNTAPAAQSLSFDSTTVTWLRNGSSPEVWRTTFDLSTNGSDWVNLGAGARIVGGWQQSGLSLPPHATIRARGFLASPSGPSGMGGDSSWWLETMAGSPGISQQPAGATNAAGTNCALEVFAGGTPPLTFQWRRNGVNLSDQDHLAGIQTATLRLDHVLGGEAGDYSVVVSNASGSVTSKVAVVAVIDPIINLQPVSQAVNAGDQVTLRVEAEGTPPLQYRWRKDGLDLAGATSPTLTIPSVTVADAGQYQVRVTGGLGSVNSAEASLTVNLATLDSWDPGVDHASYITPVFTLAAQPDGRILLGGLFGTVAGQKYPGLCRFNQDGSLDLAFNPQPNGGQYPGVYCLAVQPDGKILVGGGFTQLGEQQCDGLGRLNADGTVDKSFQSGVHGTNYPSATSLVVQPDGKILVAGNFTSLAGQSRSCLGRLEADGSLDEAFNPPLSEPGQVYALALQLDGKILAGGWTSIGYLFRLNADGTVDASFQAKVSKYVFSLVVQPDGKILVAGSFDSVNDRPCPGLARLNADGTLDSTFQAASSADCLVLQADGKILISPHTGVSHAPNFIRRLNADGSMDWTFNYVVDDFVSALALQNDGQVLVGGAFTHMGNAPRHWVGRLNNTEPATHSLLLEGGTVRWQRDGSSPAFWRTTFAFSNDGTNWTELGDGQYLSGGWQLTNVALSLGSTIRARGWLSCGSGNGTTSFIEERAVIGPPKILIQTSGFGLTDSQFGFRFTGPPGQRTLIERSVDLKEWRPIRTNVLDSVPIQLLDPISSAPAQFYRVRLLDW